MAKKIPVAVSEYIMVRHIPNDEEDKTESGIIVTQEDRKRNGDVVFLAKGEVVSAGGKADLPQVKLGDIIFYNAFDAQTVVIENQDYHVIHCDLVKAHYE